jgi:NTE family protein
MAGRTTARAAVTHDLGTVRKADLVLEGGGVKGIGLAGALVELERGGWVFPRVAGTSAGAIAASLVAALNAAGRPLSDLETILRTVDYKRFTERPFVERALGGVADVGELLLHMGLYDGDYLTTWLGDALTQLGITRFGQLRHDDPGADATLSDSQRYTLVVHAADLTRSKLVRLPWDLPTYGVTDLDEELIVDAVRASMSIPFFFRPVQRKAKECTVDGVHYPEQKVTWVDGGLLSNFPVEVFDRADGAPSRWPTLGLKLSARELQAPHGTEVDSALDEALACLRTLLENSDRYYVTTDRARRTIFIDSAGVSATDFGLTPAQQQTLYENGVLAARDWTRGLASFSPATI